MLCYNRIYKSEETDPTNSNRNKEYLICYYWFFNHGFDFQDSLCNSFHDLEMLSVNISDTIITTIKNVD